MADSFQQTSALVLVPLHAVAAVYAAWKDTDLETTQSLAYTLARQLTEENAIHADGYTYLSPAGIVILTCRMTEHVIASQRAMDEYRKFPR